MEILYLYKRSYIIILYSNINHFSEQLSVKMRNSNLDKMFENFTFIKHKF